MPIDPGSDAVGAEKMTDGKLMVSDVASVQAIPSIVPP